MELTEQQKKIAWDGFNNPKLGMHESVYAAVSAVLEMRDRGHEALRVAAQKLMDVCYVIGWNSLPMSLLHDFQAVKEALVGDGTLEGRSLIDNEILADLYIRLSGKTRHASDCATSVAPADTPGPCDCNVPEPAAQPPADGQLVEQRRVVDRMVMAKQECEDDGKADWSERGMVAALAIAREGWVALPDVEKAVHNCMIDNGYSSVPALSAAMRVRARLKPEPAKQDRVADAALQEVISTASCTKCGARVADRSLHKKWHAELAEKGKAE